MRNGCCHSGHVVAWEWWGSELLGPSASQQLMGQSVGGILEVGPWNLSACQAPQGIDMAHTIAHLHASPGLAVLQSLGPPEGWGGSVCVPGPPGWAQFTRESDLAGLSGAGPGEALGRASCCLVLTLCEWRVGVAAASFLAGSPEESFVITT